MIQLDSPEKPLPDNPKKNRRWLFPNPPIDSVIPATLIGNDSLNRGFSNAKIYFREDKATLDINEIKKLEKVIQYIKEVQRSNEDISKFSVSLDGFSSHTGRRADNLALSQSRCHIVKTWLEDHGCKIEIKNPVAWGQTEDKNLKAVVIRVLVK